MTESIDEPDVTTNESPPKGQHVDSAPAEVEVSVVVAADEIPADEPVLVDDDVEATSPIAEDESGSEEQPVIEETLADVVIPTEDVKAGITIKYTRPELIAVGKSPACQVAPKWSMDAFTDMLQGSFSFVRPEGDLDNNVGAAPVAIKAGPPRAIPGVDGVGEAWKGDTWRAPVKSAGISGSPEQNMGGIRSRLLDDGTVGSPPDKPPGLGIPAGPQQRGSGGGGDKPWQRAWRGGEEGTNVVGSPNRRTSVDRAGMVPGPRGPPVPGPRGPPAEWNGRAGSAEQRGGFMQRAAPSAARGVPAADGKTPADSDRDWRKSKDPSKPPEPTREWQQHGVGPHRRSMDAAPAQPWAGEGGPPPRGRMTPAEMEEERKQMQKEWRDLQSSKAAAAAAGQMGEMTDDDWATMKEEGNSVDVLPAAETAVEATPQDYSRAGPPGFSKPALQPVPRVPNGEAAVKTEARSRFQKFFKVDNTAAAAGTSPADATQSGAGASRALPPPAPAPERGTMEHFLNVGGPRSSAPISRAAPALQRFSFDALVAAVPSAAPLPAMPSGAKTLSELEGQLSAGGPSSGKIPPTNRAPPGYTQNAPSPPQAATDLSGGQGNLLSLLNRGGGMVSAPVSAEGGGVVSNNQSSRQQHDIREGFVVDPVRVMVAQHEPPAVAGSHLLAMLQSSRSGSGQLPARSSPRIQRVAPVDEGTDEMLALLEQKQGMGSRGSAQEAPAGNGGPLGYSNLAHGMRSSPSFAQQQGKQQQQQHSQQLDSFQMQLQQQQAQQQQVQQQQAQQAHYARMQQLQGGFHVYDQQGGYDQGGYQQAWESQKLQQAQAQQMQQLQHAQHYAQLQAQQRHQQAINQQQAMQGVSGYSAAHTPSPGKYQQQADVQSMGYQYQQTAPYQTMAPQPPQVPGLHRFFQQQQQQQQQQSLPPQQQQQQQQYSGLERFFQ